MFDIATMREELALAYDLAPNPDLAEELAPIYARMDRVVTPVDWVRHAPYVAAINKLKNKSKLYRKLLRKDWRAVSATAPCRTF